MSSTRNPLFCATRYVVAAIALGGATLLHAAEVKVAVAANFTAAMKEIVTQFEASSGHTALVSYGSTGKLYAQIENGAPYGLFLSADASRPQMLEEAGRAVPGSRFTYAKGKLTLWSATPGLVDAEGAVLKAGGDGKIAIANPKGAPYGAAAVQVLEKLGLWEAVQARVVQGDSISQTYQFVSTGNAPIGFVALAQVALLPADQAGSRWDVPQSLYDPIEQQAVLLDKGADNEAAKALHAYLQSDAAHAIIERYGYGL